MCLCVCLHFLHLFFGYFSFIYLFCAIQICFCFYFIVLHFILFYNHFLEACLFPNERKYVSPDEMGGEEDLTRLGRKETVIRTYCMGKITFKNYKECPQ